MTLQKEAWGHRLQHVSISGPGCSKLTTSLVNETLTFSNVNISNMPIFFFVEKLRCFSHFFSTKNISVFGYKVVKHLTS